MTDSATTTAVTAVTTAELPLLLLQCTVGSLSVHLQQSISLVHLVSLYYMVVQACWRGSACWLS